jgi:ABC-2 type transport system permease protein
MKNRFQFYARMYILIVAQYIKARMAYKADFFMSLVGIFFRDLTGFLALMVIFKSIPLLDGWNFYQIMFLYFFSLLSLTPLQLLFDNIWQLRYHIVEGSFIKYYFRPLNMMFYYMSEVFDLKGISQLMFACAGFVYSWLHLGIPIDKIPISLLLLASSSLIMVALMILAAVPAFWIMNPFALLDLMFRIREYSRYPLTIFNSVFRFLFTFVIPLGFMAHYPVGYLIGGKEIGPIVFLAPLFGIGLFTLAYLFWVKGVNSYSGTGS